MTIHEVTDTDRHAYAIILESPRSEARIEKMPASIKYPATPPQLFLVKNGKACSVLSRRITL